MFEFSATLLFAFAVITVWFAFARAFSLFYDSRSLRERGTATFPVPFCLATLLFPFCTAPAANTAVGSAAAREPHHFFKKIKQTRIAFFKKIKRL
ncbi:hypothetical protein [Methanimicrococcus stummii]|uniref:hypothetical protein n=1 Tax=Methanimicrococcus stummii TaxID=3028294 RepID=UPI002930F7D5|nr:hypothetical protein [Methanimicrococcus sp. Es2]